MYLSRAISGVSRLIDVPRYYLLSGTILGVGGTSKRDLQGLGKSSENEK
jgi:hypothetical protein